MAKGSKGISIKKEENFTEWFTQVVLKAELADYSDVSGCMVLRPYAYEMWEKIKHFCDKEFKKLGVKNTYFPLFIPEKAFEKQKEHVEGFSPEVAWVTQAGDTKLNEKIAIRPTSEAIMYESYKKWIRSWRDLPLLLNQWNNVVRWEFNNPVLFFRTREFLWNEMHTVFATEKQALEHGKKVMKSYDKITEGLMAIPGIYGRKTDKEKFAGAVFSDKVHSYLPNGKVIEGTCFHYDGQNFSKSYGIEFLDKDEKSKNVFQNTHAISTRMLGTMIAMHSDNKGLVLPPKMASNQVVIVPLLFKGKEKKVLDEAKKIKSLLKSFNPILDEREDYSPGYKFSEWELKGIPLRIEIGPRDIENNSVVLVKRNSGEKNTIKINSLKKQCQEILNNMQKEIFDNAKKSLDQAITKTEDKKELIKLIKNKKIVKIPLENSEETEDILKHETEGAKTLFVDPEKTSVKGKKCIISNKPANYWVYVGKTY